MFTISRFGSEDVTNQEWPTLSPKILPKRPSCKAEKASLYHGHSSSNVPVFHSIINELRGFPDDEVVSFTYQACVGDNSSI
jgi:hypothetical protein